MFTLHSHLMLMFSIDRLISSAQIVSVHLVAVSVAAASLISHHLINTLLLIFMKTFFILSISFFGEKMRHIANQAIFPKLYLQTIFFFCFCCAWKNGGKNLIETNSLIFIFISFCVKLQTKLLFKFRNEKWCCLCERTKKKNKVNCRNNKDYAGKIINRKKRFF